MLRPTIRATRRSALAWVLFPAVLLAACATRSPTSSEPVRVNSSSLQTDRHLLAGTIATVPGYLVSARMIGGNVCFRVLVDETLRFAPELLIENAGRATEPTPDLKQTYQRADPRVRARRAQGEPRRELEIQLESEVELGGPWPTPENESTARTYALLESHDTGAAVVEPLSRTRRELARADDRVAAGVPSGSVRRAAVIQACKRPPTSANKEAVKHALEWLDPLEKPARIENAPDLASLRRELQLFYLERSRLYGWARIPWDEVVLTGVVLSEDAIFEDEIVGGVDLVPYLVRVYDAQRSRWLILDLTFNDGVAKELMLGVGKSMVGL